MTDIIEIHWNARACLADLRIKVGSGSLDPRAERLFAEVRDGAVALFPDCVTLVRIATRSKGGVAPVRIVRSGIEQDDLGAVPALIEHAVRRAALGESEVREEVSPAKAPPPQPLP